MFSYTPVYPSFPTYAEGEDTAANAKPVTQTIKTDPTTGEQTMTVSGSVRDLTAANPLTPTVTGPAVPQDLQPTGFAPQPAPAMSMPEMPQPGEPVQVAGPAQLPESPVARQFAGQAPLGQTAQPAMAAQTAETAPAVPAPVAAPQAQPAQAPAWFNHIQNIQGDTAGLASYYGNKDNPAEGREFARTLLRDELARGQQQQAAQKTVDKAVATGDMLPLMREIKKSSEEGSYIKAYLYNRLGLTELAKEEQQKLGAGNKFQTVIGPDGRSQALIQFDANGLPKKGFDQAGQELTPQDLAKYAAGALPTKAHLLPSVHGTPVKNAQGEMGLMMYDPRTQQSYVQVGAERRAATGWTTMAQSAVDVYNAAAAGQTGKQVAQTTPTGAPIPSYVGTTGAAVPAPTAAPAVTTAAPSAPAAPVAPPAAAAAPAMPAAPARPAAPAAAPAAPAIPAAPAMPAAPRAGAAGAVTPSLPQQPGESFLQYQQRLQREGAVAQAQATQPIEIGTAQAKANIEVGAHGAKSAIDLAKEVEEKRQKDIVDVKKALPSNESNATAVLKTVDDVLTHPGYKDVVGMPSLSGIANMYGTNARDFRAKYNQLMGQQFLAAFNQLKGGGSISEIEGAKAEQAIAALKDPNISEKEFKRNAEILKQTVQSGIDRQRVTVGFEPKYRPFNDEEKKAFSWAKAHERDPRAQEIINRLQNR